jgi:hypothetical protein
MGVLRAPLSYFGTEMMLLGILTRFLINRLSYSPQTPISALFTLFVVTAVTTAFALPADLLLVDYRNNGWACGCCPRCQVDIDYGLVATLLFLSLLFLSALTFFGQLFEPGLFL